MKFNLIRGNLRPTDLGRTVDFSLLAELTEVTELFAQSGYGGRAVIYYTEMFKVALHPDAERFLFKLGRAGVL